MFPHILERDTPIHDWRTAGTSWSTSAVNTKGRSYNCRSDGILHPKYGTLSVHEDIAAITAATIRGAGINMVGPEAGVEFTPYAINCVAMSGDADMHPILFIGESIAAITSDAGGDLVTEVHHLAVGRNIGTEYSGLEYNGIILINPNTADRGVCIGVGMHATATNVTTGLAWMNLQVRRLVGVSPAVYDTRKQ